jgi:hypothetical protein
MVTNCPVCGSATSEVDDISDLLISCAIRKGVEVVHLGQEPELLRHDGIGALLRFRADQNTEVKKAG